MASEFLKRKAQEYRNGQKKEGGSEPPSTAGSSYVSTTASGFLRRKAEEQAVSISERFGENAYGGTKWRNENSILSDEALTGLLGRVQALEIPGSAAGGLKTSGGFYSRPADPGEDFTDISSQVSRLSGDLRAYSVPLQSAVTDLEKRESSLKIAESYLTRAWDAYSAAPSEGNAEAYNQIAAAYDQARQAYTGSYESYKTQWDRYKAMEDRVVQIVDAYRKYTGAQQAAYDDWRGTIRDAAAIKQEITGVKDQIQKLEALEGAAKVGSFLGNIGENVIRSSSGLPGNTDYRFVETSEELHRLRQLRDLLQEELDWSGYYFYDEYTKAKDFAQKSVYATTANGLEPKLNSLAGIYTETGFDDLTYDYINRNPDARSRASVNSIGDNSAFLGLDKSYLGEMDDYEIGIFNYLYATEGADAAYRYTAQLTGDLNRRQREKQEAKWAEYAREHPVGSSAFTVLTSPLKGLSYLGQVADLAATGDIDPNAAYNKFSYVPGTMREEVAKTIEESGKWGPVGSFAYQTGLSMADFLFATGISGGNSALAMTIMGSGAAADTTMAAKERGVEGWKAMTLGALAGIAEAVTEKVSIDTLLNPELLMDGTAMYILKNALAEGAEEGASDLINLFCDILIAGGDSQWRQSVDAYMADGKTEKDAFLAAFADQVITLGLDVLGGTISGAAMSGGNALIQSRDNNFLIKKYNLNNIDENGARDIINSGMESAKDTESYRLAEQLKEKMDAGTIPTADELARLCWANERAIREEGPAAEEVQEEEIPEGLRLRAVDEEGDTGEVSAKELLAQAKEDLKSGKITDERFDEILDEVMHLEELEDGTSVKTFDTQSDKINANANGGNIYGNIQRRAEGSAAAQPGNRSGIPGGTGLLHGGSQRYDGTGSPEQAGSLAGSAEQRSSARADRSRATAARQNYARSLRLEKVSSLDLGLQNGTDVRNIQIMPQEHWDAEMTQLADRIYNETGKGVTYVMGRIQIRGAGGSVGYARGVITGERIIVQVDNLRLSMEQIADHEAYHAKAEFTDGRLNAEIRRHITETFSEEEFRKVLDKYIVGLRGVIDVNEARTDAEFEAAVRQIEEEIFADAYAGINAFSAGADRFTGTVNEKMDQLYMGKIRDQDNGTEEPTGPPSDRYSFAGEHANNADLDALARAKEMRSAGVADETIRQQTGWHVGMDGKWRWEIDDSGMRYDSSGDLRGAESAKWAMDDYETAREDLWGHADMDTLEKVRAYNRADIAGDEATKQELHDELVDGQYAYYFSQYVEAMARAKGARNAPAGSTLQDYIDHPALFEAYPQLRNVTMRFDSLGGGMMGYYSRTDNEIVLNTELRYAAEDTLVHEIQHAIQKAEGFARGSNEEYWQRRQNSEDPVKAYDTKIRDSEKQVEEIMRKLPENVAEQFRKWSAMDESSQEAMMLMQELGEGPYADLFDDYFMLTWGLNDMRRSNYKRGPVDLYRNTAGEIEARDAASRRSLTQELRRAQAPARADDRTVFVEDVDDAVFAELDAEYGPLLQSSAAEFDQDTISGNIQQVAQMEPVTGISGQEFTKGEVDLITQVEIFFNQNGNRAYNPELGEVILDRKGVKSDIAYGIGRKKAAAFAAVPDVIERGLVVDYQKDWKGRGYDTAVVAAPITIGDQTHVAAVILVRSNQTNRFYVHEVLATENGALPFKTGTREGYPGGDAPSVFSILDRIRAVKNQGKQTDRFSVDEMTTAEYDALDNELQSVLRGERERILRERLGEDGYEKYRANRKARSERITMEARQADKIRRQVEANKRKLRVEAETAKVNHEERRRLRQETAPIKAKKTLRNTVINLFSIPTGQRAELGTMIDSYADRLIKNGSLTEDDRKAFFDRMYDAGVMVMPADEYSAFARSHIADGRIYVSDSVRHDFGDDWADIRRRAFAAGVYLVNDRSASGIDQWNATLSAEDMLPGLFDSEETDERVILERIIQVAEEGKDEHLSLAEYTRRLSGQEGISEDEFLDNMERQLDWALRSFAQSAGIEIELREQDIRRQAGTKRQNVKLRAKIAAERQERRESARLAQERKELQELQQRTLKQLQWLSKNRHRAPEELKETWDEVLGDIDLYAVSAADEMRWSDKYNATWKDLAQMYKDAMKNDPNFLPSKELERIVTRLDATKIADMDLGALQDLYKAAIGLRTEFYNRNNVINDEMQRLFAEVYTDAKREIESAPGGFTGGVADKFLNLDQLTPMNVLQRMAGWDPDGAFYSMAKQLERGERDMRAYSVKAQKMLQDFLTEHEDWVKKADGQGKDAIWYEVEVPQLLELGMGDKPIFGPTVKVYMTPAQKVHMYLESKNLDNLRHMTGGRTFVNKDLYSRGKRQEALSQGRTIKLAPETVRKLVSDLTPEEMELARILDRYYNTFATQEINKVSNILYGYDKAMGKNYAPIYTNRNYTKTEFGVFDTTAEGVGNLKGRQYAVNPSYNISAFDAFERHVDQTARFCGMAIPARNWTTLMNWREKNNSTGDVITHKWGEEGKRYITDLITTLQAGDDAKSDTISSGAAKLQSNYISAVFGANPSIVLKQLGSIPLAGAYLDARNMPTPAQISKIDRSLISKYTQELEWRTMGYATPETKQLKDNPTTAMDILDKVAGKATDKLKVSQKTKQRVNKTLEAAFNGGAITAMDGWAASTLWPWAENKVRRDHPELAVGTKAQIDSGESAFYKKVAEEFENAISRSQSVSDEMHQGTLRKSRNIVTKTFTMFRSDSAQTYNALRQKIGEAQFYARTGAKDKVQAASKKAVGAVVCALLMNTVWSEAVSFLMALWKNKGKYYRDDEDELTAESVIGEMGRNMMESIMGTVTFGDEIAQLIGNAITGDRRYDLEAPGLEQINEIFNLVQDLLQGNFGRISEAADVVKNGGNLEEYLSDNSGEILGEIKDTATKVATYFGLSVNNVEGYLLGALKWISPELGAAYDDLFQNIGKSDLAGMEGDALEGRVGRILSDRNVSESDDTAAALAALYEAGYKTAIPSDTPTSVSIDGEKHSLGDYQQQAYDTIWGGIVADALDDMVASDSFKEADPKTQAKMLSNLYTYAAEQAKAELFDEYELDSGAAKNAAIVAAGATVAECITWNTITSEMKSGEKSAELASWDIPEEAKREIFCCKISDSREDSITAFDEAGLSFDQFLQAYSMYGQINNEDLKAGMKAVEFSHWVNAQGYTEEQAAVVKDELTYFNMTPASSSRYDELVRAGMDPDEAYDLTGALNELQPEDGEDEVTDIQRWRASVDFSENIEIQLASLSAAMTGSQFQKVEIAYDFGIDPDSYVRFYEIRSQYDEDGNGSYKQTEIKAAIDAQFGYLSKDQKAALWQIVSGTTSAKNNPYSQKIGQQVLDARAAAKETAEREELEGLSLGNW